jgi:cyclopropane-fatty-acyl-phospholipid synthase
MNATTSQASLVSKAGYNFWLERGLIPDWLLRIGIRRIVASGLHRQQQGGPAAQAERLTQFIYQLRQSPIAIRTDAANAQHYEVPTEFYRLVLGAQMKYSCCLRNAAATNLEQAEEEMLDLTCHRARLEDGQEVLELGCGWGSLSLYMAARYPKSHILAVSNSHSQKKYIDAEAARRGLANLQVITADMNEFTTEKRFDRIVSVEMFEHMRNYPELMRRLASWSRPDALLFVHIFAHQRFAYPYEVRGANDWMAEHFFTGGVMPSDDLLLYFQNNFRIRDHWRFSGVQYQKTCEAWLDRLDRHKPEILGIFAAVYGKEQARSWLERWRVFFMACSEMFGFESGNQWIVSHYLFQNRTVSNTGGTLA